MRFYYRYDHGYVTSTHEISKFDRDYPGITRVSQDVYRIGILMQDIGSKRFTKALARAIKLQEKTVRNSTNRLSKAGLR